MEGKLKLNDLLGFTPEELSRTKIRLNTDNGWENPIDIYKENPKRLLNWNYHNNKHYRANQFSIGLVNMGNDSWLLFTVGRVIRELDEPVEDGISVEYETLGKYSDLFGRVVLSYHNSVQQLFRNADSIIEDLFVKEILPSKYTGFDFPGYQNVHLTYKQLSTIIKGNYRGYRNALERQKAVYVITDTSNGKLYVGSATSDQGMLLARWTSYVMNGHGGNKELKEIVMNKGFEYIKDNFTYAILENFDEGTQDNYVLGRESYWKEVLDTRKHGYNSN